MWPPWRCVTGSGFWWTMDAGQLRLKTDLWLRSLMWSVFWGSVHRSYVREVAMVVPCVLCQTWQCKSLPGCTGFEVIKGSWRETKDWHCVAGLEFLKTAWEMILVEVQPSFSKRSQHFGDASTMGWPPKQQQRWSGANQSLEGMLCVLQRREPEKWPQPFGGSQKILSEFQTLNTELFLEFCFALNLVLLWLSPGSFLLK